MMLFLLSLSLPLNLSLPLSVLLDALKTSLSLPLSVLLDVLKTSLSLSVFGHVLYPHLMIRRPPRSTPKPSSAASDVYKRQVVIGVMVMEVDKVADEVTNMEVDNCLLYTSPSPRDLSTSRMPSSA